MASQLPTIEEAKAAVDAAAEAVHAANLEYIKACKLLAQAKLEQARSEPHPWFNMPVYRIMGGGALKHRKEHGRVCFKDFGDDDYGNPHIPHGAYYVLTDSKQAAWLDNSWLVELL